MQSLQRSLAHTPDAASAMASEINRAKRRVEEIAVLAAGLRPHNLGLDRESYSTVPGLSPLAQGAGDIAAEVQRRLDHLKSCQSLVDQGFTYDSDSVFLDLPAMDGAKITEAMELLEDALAASATEQLPTLMTASEEIAGLNAGETDALVANLTDAQLAEWNDALDADSMLGLLSRSLARSLSYMLFSRLSEEQVDRVSEHMAMLQPALDADHLGDAFDPVYVDISGASVEDISQGELGDCWFLAALGSEMVADSDFLREHMVANENGTYTVTFYQDGDPVDVTVDGTAPGSYAGPGWLAIYEKAFAQLNGGYAPIDGGYSHAGMESLTGRDADKIDEDDLSLAELEEKFSDGTPIAVGTNQASNGHLWWKDDKDTFEVSGETVVSRHAYIVVGFDLESDPPVVQLRNPWGEGAAADEIITMTEDEIDDNFDNLYLG